MIDLRRGSALAPEQVRAIRRRLELDHCKWDAQVGDRTALYGAPLLLRRAAWAQLEQLAESLFVETLGVEQELLDRPELFAELGVPRRLRASLRGKLTPSAGRVMRFDFHPTTDGWRISEVNSDVPGGYSEATHLTRFMATTGTQVPGDPTAALVQALRTAAGGMPIGLVCAPGFMEDQQVVSQMAQVLGAEGMLLTLDQLSWLGGTATVAGRPLGAIFRFFQAEWLAALPSGWQALFAGGRTPVANPADAILSESKRLPLVWDRLKTPLPTWRRLLPETRELRKAPWASDDGWLLKSAYCNNGDTISIRSELPRAAWLKRSWLARLNPRGWLAQRRFEVTPLRDEEGELYPCIGVYVVNGAAAGAYTRVTRGAVIDFAAALLID